MESLAAFRPPKAASKRSVLVHFRSLEDVRKFRRRLASSRHLGLVLGITRETPESFSEERERAYAREWRGMPRYSNVDCTSAADYRFHLRDTETAEGPFADLLQQRVRRFEENTEQPSSGKQPNLKGTGTLNPKPRRNVVGGHQNIGYWWPPKPQQNLLGTKWVSAAPVLPTYPIYIVSKGRADYLKTSKALDRMQVPYFVAVEPQEYARYRAAVLPRYGTVLRLPFRDLGQGSIPARNWVWEHAKRAGHRRHWVMDDNIRVFYRRDECTKVRAYTGAIFRAAESFVDRYSNVALAGLQYQQFCADGRQYPPFTKNTRAYSCILVDNALAHRWRGKYNEDTDLALRVLKDGLCTLQFNAFVTHKLNTMLMPGGNTDEVYARGKNRREFAESLQRQHPDVATVTQRYGRWHHQVNYAPFKNNRLVPRPGLKVPARPQEFGMRLIRGATSDM